MGREAKPGTFSSGDKPKLVARVDQVTFSGRYARQCGQRVTYVTERAVSTRGDEGLVPSELAPGTDFERDVLARMAVRPQIALQIATRDAHLFAPGLMGRAADLSAAPAGRRSRR